MRLLHGKKLNKIVLAHMKIVVLTGTRAEYGILKSLLSAIDNDSELDLSLIVTGMHLSSEFGLTVDMVKDDGWDIGGIVPMSLSGDSKVEVAQSVGLGVINHTTTISLLKPDLIIVLGDRIEPLSAAISAAILGVPVAHISGGDLTLGSIDDTYRVLISKIAQLHFVSTQTSYDRLISLGEDASDIYKVGSLTIDDMPMPLPNNNIQALFFKIFGFPYKQEVTYAIVLYHPETVLKVSGDIIIDRILRVTATMFDHVLVIMPNNDSGHSKISSKINSLLVDYKNIHRVHNLARNEYLELLQSSNILIGNSSSGIVECSFLHVPVINIGDRQLGRERSNNVIDISNSDVLENETCIVNSINKVLLNPEFKILMENGTNIYGERGVSKRIVDVIKSRRNITSTPKKDPLTLNRGI